MIESFKKALDNRLLTGAILTDLSKAFDCLKHDLLIAKLNAYGFDNSSLKYILSYLSKRKNRTKVNNSYISWSEIKTGVTLLEWFCNNSLKANPDKFHLILSNSDEDKLVMIEHTEILNSNCEKLLEIKIDNKLSFEDHVTDH